MAVAVEGALEICVAVLRLNEADGLPALRTFVAVEREVGFKGNRLAGESRAI